MEQWTIATKATIDKHCKDFNVRNYSAKMKEYGGFDAYVKSLGGVFAECLNKTDKVTTVSELHKRIDYVTGLMAIWGLDYNNGKTYWRWGCGKGTTAASDAFRTAGRGKCASGDVKKILNTPDIVTTNCNYGVDTLMKSCGYNIWSCDFSKMIKNGGTIIRDKSKLKPGDLVHMFSSPITSNDYSKWKNWKHIAVVYEVSDGKVWMCDFGNRFVKQKKPLHYMPIDSSAKTGGEYTYSGWAAVRFAEFKDDTKKEVIPMLNGVDIASYQTGIDFARVPADFVIVKATEGTGYVNPDCNRAFANAKANGKLLGLYHYSNGVNATVEADFFVKNIKNYIGSAILVLDWESGSNMTFGKNDVAFCKAFLDRVYEQTKVRPLIYMSQSVVLAHDWTRVAKYYGLWLAQYVVDSVSGYDPNLTHGNTGVWDYPAIWQYTSGGHLNGWNGRLDLNVAYMTKVSWKRYATGDNSKEEEEDIPVPKTVKFGSTGVAVTWVQEMCKTYYVNGKKYTLTVDGKFKALTEQAVKYWQKQHGLTVDGIVGPKTWRAMIKSLA